MNDAYLYLKITPENLKVLERALSIRLETLRFETARTDDHDYRVDLQHQLECLEGIHRDLKELGTEKKSA